MALQVFFITGCAVVAGGLILLFATYGKEEKSASLTAVAVGLAIVLASWRG